MELWKLKRNASWFGKRKGSFHFTCTSLHFTVCRYLFTSHLLPFIILYTPPHQHKQNNAHRHVVHHNRFFFFFTIRFCSFNFIGNSSHLIYGGKNGNLLRISFLEYGSYSYLRSIFQFLIIILLNEINYFYILANNFKIVLLCMLYFDINAKISLFLILTNHYCYVILYNGYSGDVG